MTYSLYANNDEFIQTNDIGLFQTKPPILKYVTEGTTTVSYQTYTSIIGDGASLLINNDISYTLAPGQYSLTYEDSTFEDENNNQSLSTIINFTIEYVIPSFVNELSQITAATSRHILDLSQAIEFPPFSIDALNITASTDSSYITTLNFNNGDKSLTIDLDDTIKEVSILEHSIITIIINFNIAYSNTNVDIEKNLLVENVYKPPAITSPTNTTLTKYYETTFTYQINHTDTLLEDLSYSAAIGREDLSYNGQIDISFINIDNVYSNIDIQLTLDPAIEITRNLPFT